MLKRWISLLLCAVMFLSMLPMQAIALEEEEEPAERMLEEETEPTEEEMQPTEEETQPTEEATEPAEEETQPSEEETQPSEEETEPTEEIEPAEEATEPTEETTEPTEEVTEPSEEATEPSAEEPELLCLEAPELDAEELLMGYLSPFYNGEGMSTFGTMARDRLSGPNRHLYDGVVARVREIANGEEDYTRVDVSFSGSGYSGNDVDIGLVQEALMLDLAYEMYWYYMCWYSQSANNVAFIMQPHALYLPSSTEEFDPNNPYIDKSKTAKTSAAATNIGDIIDKYKTASDYEKLAGYADEICALVEYDYDAAEDSDALYPVDNRSWTLVNVFDGDTDTNVVCEGYSEAYQYLCDETTFQGDIVCFSATGNNHKWNIVRIDGVSYLMDVTHCDDGSVATRGPKFLGGGSGSVTGGYSIGGFMYAYYDDTLAIYGTGDDSILKLSPTPYTPAGTYAVVYSVAGDTGWISGQTKTQGVDLIITETVPYILGYNFVGWTVSPTGMEADYQPGDTYSADADIVLYALFEESEVITDSEPGSSWTANVRYPGVTVLYTFRPEKSGYYRIYSDADNDTVVDIYDAQGDWIAGDDDSGGSYQFQLDYEFQAGQVYYIDVMFFGNTLTGALPFAVSRRLTISYDANGGTGAPGAEYQYYQFPTALSDVVPTRDGDTFLGWAASSTATAAEYQPGETFNAEDDVTFYAVWQKAVCTHSFGDYTTVKEPTCEEPGMEERSCSLCGETESQEIPAAGHTEVTVPGVAATCTEDGLTDGTECSVCGEVITKQEVIPAGHTVVDGICTACQVYGTCGENLTWTLDEEGNLTISGTGDMYNYHLSRNPSPWTGMGNIQKVIIEKGATSIGNYAFHECANMSSITIPEGVTGIGMGAFGSCSNLTSIDLPDTITSISGRAFWGCTGLKDIVIPEGVARIYAATFFGCSSLVSVMMPENVTSIELNAFNGCSSLTNVIIPDGVESIGNNAFSKCTSLQEVTLPDSVTSIGTGLFSGCTNLRSVKLPANLTSIGSSTFSECAMTGIDLPDSITSIGTRAFFGCRNLSSIELPAELISIDQEAFYGCTDLTSVAVPAKLTTIGTGAFEACQNLRDVYITDLAAWAGSDLGYAFSSSHGNEIWLYLDKQLLTDVVIPDGMTAIGSWAFANCTQLSSVTLPEGITAIGEYAFLAHDGATGIDKVTFLGDALTFAENAFSGTTATAYYPANNATWTSDVMLDYGGTITWVPYGGVENQVTIPAAELSGHTSVWIDGKEYAVSTDSGVPYVDLPDGNAKTMVAYTYQNANSEDVHTHIPTGMTVWTLSNTDGLYTATRVEELDDMLGYQGCSIRIKGNQGIRMITSIDQTDKDALTTADLAGYTLEEYGTAVAWASQLSSTRPLVLGKNYVSSNYAYKKDVADPIFGSDGNVMQYTNVLVGFTLDQCRDDLAMRPYMILKNADGETITLYGAIVERSIGYIAQQNKENVEEGTEAYDYVWNIITHVYGEVPEA